MNEETGIMVKEVFYVGLNERFRVFPDGKECLCRCAIYYTYIDDQIPIHTKPKKHSNWIFVDLKNLSKYKLTDTLALFLQTIIEIANKKFRNIN